jgi:long-chain acyl-CoA synthetase
MNVPYCLRRAAQIHGQAVAYEHDGQETTYGELWTQARRSAAKLRALGIEKGDRVAVLLLNGPAYLDLYYSIALAGALVVPMNTRWNQADVEFVVDDSDSKLLVVDDRFVEVAKHCGRSIHHDEILCGADPVAFDEPGEDDLAGLFYTSGTTGGPKGAMLTHRNIFSNAIAGLVEGFSTAKRWLHAAPMFHLADAGAIHGLTLNGGTHYFLPSFDPETALGMIERHRIKGLVLVPTMINLMINHPSFGKYDLSSLHRIAYGASPMPLPLLRESMAKLGCEFLQGYGMTEASPLLTVLAPEHHVLENTERRFAPVKSAGKPVAGVEIRVVDEDDRDTPTGEVGEVIARGPNIMRGYWKREAISSEVLRGGWLHTGDLGAFDEQGFLYIYDRKKDMIKTGGENVYSPEVESAICSHPAVLEAAVIGVEHPTWGETIRAIAVIRPGFTLTEEELIGHCRSKLSHFKCPRSAVFTDALPKGGSGKIQKNALRSLYG